MISAKCEICGQFECTDFHEAYFRKLDDLRGRGFHKHIGNILVKVMEDKKVFCRINPDGTTKHINLS